VISGKKGPIMAKGKAHLNGMSNFPNQGSAFGEHLIPKAKVTLMSPRADTFPIKNRGNMNVLAHEIAHTCRLDWVFFLETKVHHKGERIRDQILSLLNLSVPPPALEVRSRDKRLFFAVSFHLEPCSPAIAIAQTLQLFGKFSSIWEINPPVLNDDKSIDFAGHSASVSVVGVTMFECRLSCFPVQTVDYNQ
jgi:hypothetical protein